MKIIFSALLCMVLLFPHRFYGQQVIWLETFDIAEKGYWGGGSDMSGITKWALDAGGCTLVSAADYIKTVSTGGGRIQAVNIDGEAIWRSEVIDISSHINIGLSVNVSETGTSTNISKYVKLYYSINGGAETLFQINGQNIGNFGSAIASQSCLNGNSIQVIIRINNPNSGDATIFDNVTISFDNQGPVIDSLTAINKNIIHVDFSEEILRAGAENTAFYNVSSVGNPISATLLADNKSVDLVFSEDFIEYQPNSIEISNITDHCGNLMTNSTIQFTYIPFKAENIFIRCNNEILLEFSHKLNKASAETAGNYFVSNGIGNPSGAILVSDTLVILSFPVNLDNNSEYLLTMNNISDLNNEIIAATQLPFIYHQVSAFDIVINEIMADVSPEPNVLPVAEYIEIYNNTEFSIDLTGWIIQIGSYSPVQFPQCIIHSKSHLIICSESQSSVFLNFGPTVGILSESQLTSGGTVISFYYSQGKLMDYIKYSVSWYADLQKEDGGWSLERIDPLNYCGESQNWKACIDFKGGTPGQENSGKAVNPDPSVPVLNKSMVLSSNKLALVFSKNIDESTAFNSNNYLLDDGSNFPVFIHFADTSRATVIIQFSGQFTDGQPQNLQIQNLKDFCGNVLNSVTASFIYYLIHPTGIFPESSRILHLIFSEEVETNAAQSVVNYTIADGFGSPSHAYKHTERNNEVYLEFSDEFVNGNTYVLHIENIKDLNGNAVKPVDLGFTYFVPSFNDIVINEILFNPKPNGFDFVEIYNKSSHALDLSKMKLAKRDDNGELDQVKNLSEINLLFEPGHFMAITTDTIQTKKDYPAISYHQFLQVPSMPSFNDDKGTVVLLFGDTIVDEFAYDDKMHFALITNTEGISLERIDPVKPTQVATNWYSAAESAGYATPANKNSQFRNSANNSSDEVTVDPETFSPNNDGFEDRLIIHYKFDEPGYVATVYIYDGKGRIIRKIAASELLGTEGDFSWDGINQDNSKARIGIYIVYFEVFNLQGEVKKYKKACVLAGRLD